MSSVFDYLNNLSYDKKTLELGKDFEDTYVPFLANRYFSYFLDTIVQANEMNLRPTLTKEEQYRYYMGTIRPKKRFTKWYKPEAMADIILIQEYYDINRKRAAELRPLFDDENMAYIRKALDKGGVPTKGSQSNK